jgi:DNA replication protein DnaC
MPCQALRTVPRNKLDIALEDIEKIEDPVKRNIVKKAYHRYFEANIPVKYWSLEMEKHFNGDNSVLEQYQAFKDIAFIYRNGLSICFVGSFGRGKTMLVTNILKRALEKGFSGLYVNLNDIMSAVKSKEAHEARKEILTVDFLVVDEFDPRYIATEIASDFYGRTLEDILRNRSQNKLPLILCSNSSKPFESFNGAIQESVNSLKNYVDVIPLFGSDYRIEEKKNG